MHRQISTLTIATLVAAAIVFPSGAAAQHAAALAIAKNVSSADARGGAKPALARNALPVSAVPGSVVGQGYGTGADVAAAGAGIVATYERTFTYSSSAGNPPYAFVDEELWAANSTTAATAKFNRLVRDSARRGGLGGLEGAIQNLYFSTVVLPVHSRPETRITPRLGDGAAEILFKTNSYCCSFEAAAVLIRVGRIDAVLFIGSAGSTDPKSTAARLNRPLVAQLIVAAARQMAARS